MKQRPGEERGPVEANYLVIGDSAASQSILLDPETGMRIDFSAETPDLSKVLDSDAKRFVAAIMIVEKTLGIFEYSEGKGYTASMAEVLVAVKRWCAGLDTDRRRIDAIGSKVGNFLYTAGWLGMKVSLRNQSPHASCNLMIGSLLKEDAHEAFNGVVSNSNLSAHIVRGAGQEVGPQLMEVYDLLAGPDGASALEQEVECWRSELADL